LWRQAGRPSSLSIIDVGAGSGDQTRWLLRWARRQQIDLKITLLDIHPETCDEARRHLADQPHVQVLQGDLFDLQPGMADIVTASLVLHHFACAELPTALIALQRAARLGVVVNDLHRHWLAWALIRLATGALSSNRMIRNDAPLSVQRGFRRADFIQLRQSHPELAELQVMWRPFFRYLVVLPAERGVVYV
jgi:ubiquinone/menaquinone biosynthesis C-methylase UbiE